MKNLFLSLALLLVAISAMAQDVPTAAQPVSLPVAQAAPDTVAAIHRLFAARRLRRNLIAGSLGAGALIGAIISGASKDDGGGSGGSGYGGAGISFDGADYLVLYAIPAVPLILLDYTIYANYSRTREAWVIEEFQAHRLPRKLKHKLKPRYFR